MSERTADMLEDAHAELARLRADRDALAAALRFYADPFNRKDEWGEPIGVPDFYNEMEFGETARAALEQHGG